MIFIAYIANVVYEIILKLLSKSLY